MHATAMTAEIIDAELIEDSDYLPATTRPPHAALINCRPNKSPEDTVIEDWIEEQKSDHTKRSYRTAIGLWRQQLLELGCCTLWWPHRRHAFAWRDEMDEAGLKPKTIDARLIAARSFYDHLCDRDDYRNPINPIKSKKLLLNQGVHQPTPALDEAEVKALIDAAERAGRDRYLMLLFVAVTGCRISEAIALKGADLQRSSGRPVAMLTRKGNKRGPASVDAQVFDMLIAHTKDTPPEHHVFQPHRAAGRSGAAFTYGGAYEAFRAIAIDAGLVTDATKHLPKEEQKSRVFPHVLRATFITTNLGKGAEVSDVQAQVGHAKADTTQGYNRGSERLREMESLSGRIAKMIGING